MAANEQKKAKALAALLESTTLTEAAEKAQISRRTLFTYIRTEYEFAEAWQSVRENIVTTACDAAEMRVNAAADFILSVMNDESQAVSIRLKAAQILLENGEKQRKKADDLSIRLTNATDPNMKGFWE